MWRLYRKHGRELRDNALTDLAVKLAPQRVRKSRFGIASLLIPTCIGSTTSHISGGGEHTRTGRAHGRRQGAFAASWVAK